MSNHEHPAPDLDPDMNIAFRLMSLPDLERLIRERYGKMTETEYVKAHSDTVKFIRNKLAPL